MKEKKEIYRPVNILNGMSKNYERLINNSLSSYAKNILLNVLYQLIENNKALILCY